MSLFTRRKNPEQLVKLLKEALVDPAQLAKPAKDGKVRSGPFSLVDSAGWQTY